MCTWITVQERTGAGLISVAVQVSSTSFPISISSIPETTSSIGGSKTMQKLYFSSHKIFF